MSIATTVPASIEITRRSLAGLLAATTENIGIAALEPHDAFPRACFRNHQRIEFVLRHFLAFAAGN